MAVLQQDWRHHCNVKALCTYLASSWLFTIVMYSDEVTHDLLYSLKVLVYAIASTCTHIMY